MKSSVSSPVSYAHWYLNFGEACTAIKLGVFSSICRPFPRFVTIWRGTGGIIGLVCERTGTTEIRPVDVPSSCSGVRGCGMIGCTARMRESLNIFSVLTDCIYDSAWASDHYALVRGRFTITKSGKRVHCAFLEQSLFSSQSFNQIPSNPACWPSKARLGDPRIRLISFPSKRGTAWQRDLPTSDLKNPIYSSPTRRESERVWFDRTRICTFSVLRLNSNQKLTRL